MPTQPMFRVGRSACSVRCAGPAIACNSSGWPQHDSRYWAFYSKPKCRKSSPIGNRAIYHDGWLAGTVHRARWERVPRATLENDKWELYDVANDFSLGRDLAAEKPEKLQELQTLFGKEAVRYNVLPIDDRTSDRFNAATSGRPDLMAGRTSLTVYEGITGMSENVFISVKNCSHTITAEVEVPPGGCRRRRSLPRRPVRRMEPALQGGNPRVQLQVAGLEPLPRRRCGAGSGWKGHAPVSVRL
jgi:hypothetical protein